MSECRFWIYIDGDMRVGPSVDKETSLEELLLSLDSYRLTSKYFKGVDLDACKLYKFPTPLLAIGKLADRVKACSDARDSWVEVDTTERVEDLASDEYLSNKYICLVIQTPQSEQDSAFHQLRTKYGTVFEALQLSVNNIMSWSRDDVKRNLKGGEFWGNGVPRTEDAFRTLESQLLAKRTYDPAAFPDDLNLANNYTNHFAEYFKSQPLTRNCPQHDVMFGREFVAFFALFRCHMEDAPKIADKVASSHMKSSHFGSHFFMPPFYCCKPENSTTLFTTETSWKFPIFLKTLDALSTWCKFTPSSDFSVRVKDFNLPLLVSEIISIRNESDRWRMLLQGIALARALHVFKKSMTNPPQLFIVAIYLRSDLVVERYIIMQTRPNGKVSIAQTDYDLKQADHSRDFLREMFNLQAKMEAMVNGLDAGQNRALQAIAKIAGPLRSLTQRRTTEGRTSSHLSTNSKRSNRLETIAEQEQDFTQADDIREVLRNKGYETNSILPRHPYVAKIYSTSNPSERGFLKYTNVETEVEILKRLTTIQTSDNHTISGVQIWPRSSEGSVIYTPSGGGHLTDLEKPHEHVWSTAKQLIEGVAFMHKNDVAHLDIKPSNVLIPVNGGRLSIIDFNSAVFVKPGKKFRGEIGTEGYMAPEVSTGQVYDACRADLWSCGKTLLDLVDRCDPTAPDSLFVADIANRLMVSDPLGRPTMLEVLDHIRAFESSPVERPKMSLRSPMTIVGARA